ncbi:cyclic nucleotide-binding domain-containing protein [Actinocrispum wychmicini]|uniref:CRP-like cAMP-binding protein n=1 Tax=Actinocrispum wychmicini TaxID=1213861 RepID=A0A4R2JQP5_9PSEU|nr:cyclic nucleotide-binding domain-containing protein [Actinocrispum wychmicini]TCO61142.1 CRP-like cAMP-binding protein [Actinocrispum wychmicini]
MGARESLQQIGQSRSFTRGQHLIRPGAPSDDVLLIESGAVKVVLGAANGAESILGFYGAGELIGEMGVMSGQPRSASVIAHVDGSALHVPAKAFRHLMETDRQVLLLVNDTLERRVRSADHRTLAIASRDVRTRVGAQLMTWGRTCGLHTKDGLLIHAQVQIKYTTETLGYPVWGMSPSSTADDTGGYGGFAAAGLALPVGQRLAQCSTCATETTATPHASFLALSVLPQQAYANIQRLRTLYPDIYTHDGGFYDAVNPVTGSVGHRRLVLDQSMIMAALDNALNDNAPQRHFAKDATSWAAHTYLSMETMSSH